MIELASILILGVFAQWLAWRIKQPAILPLIILGLAAGPLWQIFDVGGHKLLDGDAFFQGEFLFEFVSISVGLILFEGGLTLKFSEVSHLAKAIRNLIFIGGAITFLGGTLLAKLILDFDWNMSFLFGALIIVTGPTVIGPILRNIRAKANINTLLKWEGILIDPVGAVVAILVYELIIANPDNPLSLVAFGSLALKITVGLVVGVILAFIVKYLLNKDLIPAYLRNVVILGLVVLAFTMADLVEKESGLLAVTITGIILANLKVKDLDKVISFKEDLTILLVSVLFILLSSRIDLEEIERLGWSSVLLLAAVIFLLRPLAVFISTIKNSGLTFKERLFISWIGPRGIVAAGVASIFSINLMEGDIAGIDTNQAALLLPVVFLIILGTVLIQGSTARFVAKKLDVQHAKAYGIIILGSNELSRMLGLLLKDAGQKVLISDTNTYGLEEAKKLGLNTTNTNLLKEGGLDNIDFDIYGQLWAMTSSNEINDIGCRVVGKEFGEDHVFRIITKRELELKDLEKSRNLLFNGVVDFYGLIVMVRRYKSLEQGQFESLEAFNKLVKESKTRVLPLFIKFNSGKILPMTAGIVRIDEEDTIYYLKS